MPIVIPTEGRALLARFCFGNPPVAGADLIIGLFVNNYIPVLGTTFANLTEATFAGYATVTRDRGDTTFAANGLARQATIGGVPIQYVSQGGNETVYGWFLRDDGSAQLIAVERFANPVAMLAGTTLVLTPTIDTGAIQVGA